MFPVLHKLFRSRVFRDISLLTMGAWISQALLLYRSYLIPGGLGPEGYGIWRLVTLILFYCTFTHLGTIEAYQRETPVLRGKGELDRMRAVGETTWTFWNSMSSLAMLLILAYAFVMRKHHGVTLTHCLYLTAPLLLLQSASYFLSAKLCTELRFAPVSISMLLNGIINVVGIWALILLGRFNIFGAIYIFILSNLITILYLFCHARPRLFPRIQRDVLVHLIGVGLPITLFLILTNTLTTIDQILILKLRGTTAMGIYGLGFSLMMIMGRVPTMITTAIEPRFLEHTGRYGLTDLSFLLISEQIVVLSLVVPLFAGSAAIAVPPLLHIFLPDFVRSIPVIHAALIGFAVFSFTYPLKSMIILRRIQWQCIPILVAGLVICFLLDLTALRFWKSALAPVAIGSTIAYVLVAVAEIQYVLGIGLSKQKGGAPAFFAEILGSMAAASILVWILLRWVRLPGQGIHANLGSMFLQGAIFVLTYGIFSIKSARALYQRMTRLIASD